MRLPNLLLNRLLKKHQLWPRKPLRLPKSQQPSQLRHRPGPVGLWRRFELKVLPAQRRNRWRLLLPQQNLPAEQLPRAQRTFLLRFAVGEAALRLRPPQPPRRRKWLQRPLRRATCRR